MPVRMVKLWRKLARVEKAFAIALLVYLLLRLTRVGGSLVGMIAVLLGLAVAFRLARQGMKRAIWRLRNRLIATYLFIAVVPILLVLTLVGTAAYAIIGQIATYLANSELSNRTESLLGPADALASIPDENLDNAVNRFASLIHNRFPEFEVLVHGDKEVHYPADSTLEPPPGAWDHASGLVVKDGRLSVWAHVHSRREVTILAPVTQQLLGSLVPGLGTVNFVPFTTRNGGTHVPPPVNALDVTINGFSPVQVARWDTPQKQDQAVLLVNTRVSAVLGTLFGTNLGWDQVVMGFFLAVAILFLVEGIASLVAGISLSRTITGAVHELYEGTQHVKEGDFSYRISTRGSDQLAELGLAFNGMTENLGRLLVIAKEKERLQSELEIARGVQAQLFPKAAPPSRSLQLEAVCHPARMVSGDYYDFIPISDTALAFAIGDVAGKGISAALLMASIQSSLRTQLTPASNGHASATPSAACLVSNLNRHLYANTSPEKYATFYFAVYDDTRRALSYTNAGHLPPLLLRDHRFERLEPTGTVVGAFPVAPYGEQTVPLETGDLLVAYTDGIVEPENAYGEMFGEERLQDLILKHEGTDTSELIARTMEAVVQWTGSSELQDDMTMLVARCV
jgi:sigma-B regulation protein RsbU (phosphoserine phosphatase)